MGHTISRSYLLKQMVRAAQIRSALTMLSAVVGLVLIVSFHPMIGDIGVCVLFFAIPLGVSCVLTDLVCRRRVICPVCGQSLWKCCNGSFKPRKLRFKKNVDACPSCHTEFSE